METLKEYLSSNRFSRFGYIVALFQLPVFVSLTCYSAELIIRERKLFWCLSSSDSREVCLALYNKQYKSLPLYGFVVVCCCLQLIVCILYSQSVKSRVDELAADLKRDQENPRCRQRLKTRRVFYSYFLHLLVRLVAGILFILLQKVWLYSDGFPSEFVCSSRTANSTSLDVRKDVSVVHCYNPVGSDYAACAKGILIVNILLSLLVFGEWYYLFVRAFIHSKRNFSMDSEFCQLHFFNMKSTALYTLEQTTLRMKSRICEETEILVPVTPRPDHDKPIRLDDIFIFPVICTGIAKQQFNTSLSKRHEIFNMYLKPQHGSLTIEKLEELFLPNRDTEDPRKILVVGPKGIGKSLLCRKLSRDWGKGKLLQNSDKGFDYMFLFQFRWFNTETALKISLEQLLISLSCPEGSFDNVVLQHMLDNPEKVLLIFDGLDEFHHHQSFWEVEQAQFGNSATEEMSLSSLYVKLLTGKLLPGATVLTTSTLNVVQSPFGHKFDRMVEIKGFTPEKVEEYVHKFCASDDEQTANKIWRHISSDLGLLSLCYVPTTSFIVCSILKELITLQDQHSESALPATSTDIYNGTLRLFIYMSHPEYKDKPLTREFLMGNNEFSDDTGKTLIRAGSLAKAGIEKSRLMFDKTEVQGMENCGLFNRMPDSRVSAFRVQSYFCFIHLTIQELLAARVIVKMKPDDLSSFITSNASDPKWHLVIKFAAGLLHGQDGEAVNAFVQLLHDSLTEWLPAKTETKQKALLMMECLHEYSDEAAVRKAASELQKNSKFRNRIDLSHCQVTPADCPAIVYFIKHLHELTGLDLAGNSVTDQGMSQLCNALKFVNCKLTELNLGDNSITDQGVSHLCGALKDVNCKLTKLDLSDNNIVDQGASHFCGALKNVNCKLGKLDLSGNRITDVGVALLCDALKDVNCKLVKLDLSGTHITDDGVSHLCSALKDVNCNLTELNLGGNKITDQGVSHLCGALKDVNCKLVKLDLSSNIITDIGVELLCDALKYVNCKLHELDLSCNSYITMMQLLEAHRSVLINPF